MAELKNTFIGGKMDKDTDERILQNGLYRSALNVSVSTSEDSDVGAAQNILGNTRVTDVALHRTYKNVPSGNDTWSTNGNNEFSGSNYHVASVIDPQTNMLYRFVHTASVPQGLFMDRIIEFDPINNKENSVFVDIFRVIQQAKVYTIECDAGDNNYIILEVNPAIDNNLTQIRWGMFFRVTSGPDPMEGFILTVESVNYNTGQIIGKIHPQVPGFNPSDPPNYNLGSINDQVFTFEFIADRNLNFGSFGNKENDFEGDPDTPNYGIRKITGINIIDGMLFWTDNFSEPKKINIKRSKMGSNFSLWAMSVYNQTSILEINNFIHHTLLINNENITKEEYTAHSACVISGCTDPTAYNYEPTAIDDDGSCVAVSLGCTDPTAINYNALANVDDGVCYYTGDYGCTDSIYCNYNPSAIIDDGSCDGIPGCTDPTAFNYCDTCGCDDGSCKPITLGCTDPTQFNYDATANIDDGSCIPFIYGCTDPTAINYDASANTDDGSCILVILGCTDSAACNYDVNANTNDGSCLTVYGCTDPTATNYDALAQCDDGSCIATIFGCTDPASSNYDPNANVDDGNCIACIYGCTDSTQVNYDPNATCNDGTCFPFQYGCTNPLACNYNPSVNTDNGSCLLPDGCTDSNSVNYDPLATCDDGSCIPFQYGCTDPNAANYNAAANNDDGSCAYPGCTDSTALNYDPNANNDDGSCIYCVYGCMDQFAADGTTQADNYDASATCSDSSCLYSGCIDPAATNYNPYANDDDGSCTYTVYGCTDNISSNCDGTTGATNLDPTANTDDGSCTYPVCGCTVEFSGTIQANNYNANATFNDGSCIYPGCMDPLADNYDNGDANVSDGSCTYTISGCTDPTATNYDPLANTDNGSCIIYGCTEPGNIAYNEDATVDDGSCVANVAASQPGDAHSLLDPSDPDFGFVNLADLTLVINNWLQDDEPVGEGGDVVGALDGFVNLSDLTQVINNWLQSTNTDNTIADPGSFDTNPAFNGLILEEIATMGSELVIDNDFDDSAAWSIPPTGNDPYGNNNVAGGSNVNNGLGTVIAGGHLGSTWYWWSLHDENVGFVSGNTYTVSFRARQVSGSGKLQISQSYNVFFEESITSNFANYTVNMVATNANPTSTGTLAIGGTVSGDVFEIDNISIQQDVLPTQNCYRLYASFDMSLNNSTTLNQVFADEVNACKVASSVYPFYNAGAFGDNANFQGDVNDGAFTDHPETQYDTWVTIGDSYTASPPSTVGPVGLGDNLTGYSWSFGDTPNSDTAMFRVPTTTLINPTTTHIPNTTEDTGRVLLGQFTSTGPEFIENSSNGIRLNIRGTFVDSNGDDKYWQEKNITSFTLIPLI